MCKKNLFIALLISLTILVNTSLAVHMYSITAVDQSKEKQIEYTYEGKGPLNGELLITNYEKTDQVTLRLDGVDALIGTTGEYYYKLAKDSQTKLGEWLKFEENEVVLNPEEKKYIRYKITIPEKTTPGVYVGGISVSEIKKEEAAGPAGSGGFGAKVVTRLIKKIYVEIPGETITKYELGELIYDSKGGRSSFLFSIRNQGNTLIAAKGTIEITDEKNYRISLPVKINGIMENDSYSGEINWPTPPKWGNFKAKLRLEISQYDPFSDTYKVLETIEKQTKFVLSNYSSLTPYFLGGLIFLLLVIIIMIKNIVYKAGCIEYVVVENDSVKSVAEKFGMNWKKLVSLNRIKAPYELTPGQKILVRPKRNA